LLKNSKCSESLQTRREHRPRRCKPNATHFVSNGRREQEILQFVHQVKQAKKMMLTVQFVQSVHADVAGPYRPYDDMASDDVEKFGWKLRSNDVSTRVIIWLVV
jgi:hypothetical protein